VKTKGNQIPSRGFEISPLPSRSGQFWGPSIPYPVATGTLSLWSDASLLEIGTKVRGSYLADDDDFLRAIKSGARLPSEVKQPVSPML
jgi:hypothetical protein